MTDNYFRLRSADTLVIQFTERMDAAEVAEWADRMRASFPERKIILVAEDTQVRIESKEQRRANRYMIASCLLLVADIAYRCLT